MSDNFRTEEEAEKDASSRLAIQTENLYLFFEKKKPPVLDHVNLHVEKGKIYGLLGPSGCGKTTLLECILGMHRPSSGTVTIDKEHLGHKDLRIPGSGVGYMPQEIALDLQTTMAEELTFYGRLFQMKPYEIKERIEFLIRLLDVKYENKMIKDLSVGEQRRVSFAAALIHSPPLLILDEPTVGVDPLLRQRIWNYLRAIAEQDETTIIITTHYIEEANQAHVVGLMRGGRMLVEMDPSLLKQQHGVSTLEEAFLKECEVSKEEFVGMKSSYTNTKNQQTTKRVMSERENSFDFKSEWQFTRAKWSALIKRQFFLEKREIVVFCTRAVLIILSTLISCLLLGRAPNAIPVAIANMDRNNSELGKFFLNNVNNYYIQQVPYPNLREAIKSVKECKTHGAIHISSQFAENLVERYYSGVNATNESIDASTIKLYMDFTDKEVSESVRFNFYEGFQRFSENLLEETINKSYLATPYISISEPVYSSMYADSTEYFIPAMIIMNTHAFAVGTGGQTIILSRNLGVLNRFQMAGYDTMPRNQDGEKFEHIDPEAIKKSVRPIEMALVTLLIMLFTQLIQWAILLEILFVVIEHQCKGSLLWVAVFSFLSSVEGLSIGLLFSEITNDLVSYSTFSVLYYFLTGFLGGVLRPVEGMPYIFRAISPYLPVTKLCKSMTNVIQRGWGITENDTWEGILAPCIWTVAVFMICFFKTRLKQK